MGHMSPKEWLLVSSQWHERIIRFAWILMNVLIQFRFFPSIVLTQAKKRFDALILPEEGALSTRRLLLEKAQRWQNNPWGSYEIESSRNRSKLHPFELSIFKLTRPVESKNCIDYSLLGRLCSFCHSISYPFFYNFCAFYFSQFFGETLSSAVPFR